MISKWVPEAEKYSFVSFVYSGGTFGTIFTYPLCGFILDIVGWEVGTIYRYSWMGGRNYI